MSELPMSRIAAIVPLLALLAGASPAWAQTAEVRYERALARESPLRTRLDADTELTPAERADTLREVTRLVAAYEGIVRRFPRSGYSDNALWQAASLTDTAYRRFARADDRARAMRFYAWLVREYPSSPYVRRARSQMAGLEQAKSVEAAVQPAPSAPEPPVPAPASVPVPTLTGASMEAEPVMSPSGSRAVIGAIQRASRRAR